jgi:predicted metal-dependent HD superfamily phosphohydrolase
MLEISQLSEKWDWCGRNLSIDRKSIDRVFQLLVTAYSQPDRHYHNLTHIHHLLTTLNQFSAMVKQPIAVHLAVWFHDFVYDTQSADNELQSADFAGELLADLGVDRVLIDRVRELILATQAHQVVSEDLDRAIFLDADLAILGADLTHYQAYQTAIRREYSWVSDQAYQAGRMRVLASFLQRDRIYHTDLLFNKLEATARSNIDREILLLKTT